MGKHKFNGNPNNLLKCRKKYLIGITIWVAFFLGYSSILTIRSCKTQAEPIFYISVRTAFVWAKDVPSIFIQNYFPSLTRFLYLQPLDDFSSGFGSVFIDSKATFSQLQIAPTVSTLPFGLMNQLWPFSLIQSLKIGEVPNSALLW